MVMMNNDEPKEETKVVEENVVREIRIIPAENGYTLEIYYETSNNDEGFVSPEVFVFEKISKLRKVVKELLSD